MSKQLDGVFTGGYTRFATNGDYRVIFYAKQ